MHLSFSTFILFFIFLASSASSLLTSPWLWQTPAAVSQIKKSLLQIEETAVFASMLSKKEEEKEKKTKEGGRVFFFWVLKDLGFNQKQRIEIGRKRWMAFKR